MGEFEGAVRPHFKPRFASSRVRWVVGAMLLVAISFVIARGQSGCALAVIAPCALGWLVSTWLTDKYTHKYPQRYYPYLLAAHAKAAVIMVLVIAPFPLLAPWVFPPAEVLQVAALMLVFDLVLSFPRVRGDGVQATANGLSASVDAEEASLHRVSTVALKQQLEDAAELAQFGNLASFVAGHLEADEVGAASMKLVNGDSVETGEGESPVALLIQEKSFNTVRRFNLFLRDLPDAVLKGGYFVFRYRPMEEYLEELRSKKRGFALWLSYGWHFFRFRALPKIPVLERLYFVPPLSWFDSWGYRRTMTRRRVISRAEMWGRMYFWGFEVLGERQVGEDHWVVTQRIRDPEAGRQPSFFLVARLAKVGLDGRPMYLHKLRTMYPFSEFIQEKIYEDHGLSETGKFKNDFRLTDYGRFLRRYWLDEIPQIFDWLRGEIKLVGMRATSPQFLSLYPKRLYDLYIQTKPGLIPPIFDASTDGFEDIVRIELAYLTAYQRRPVMADVRYFFKTLHDIFVRGVRSK
ncbi:MAG: sugar transferase [Verrucomicrobiales bacterium]